VQIDNATIQWMKIPADSILQSYVPRMEWAHGSEQLIVQHLNRKQNVSNMMLCNAATGEIKTIYTETDSAWIDILPEWDDEYAYGGWDWLHGGKDFLWASEKDGWRHLYSISLDGKKESLITKGNFDVMKICAVDEKSGYVYFYASPGNATQQYLYRTKLDGSGAAQRLSPMNETGWHEYEISPTGEFAQHEFSNYYTPSANEWVSLPLHKAINGENVQAMIAKSDSAKSNIHFFSITTDNSVSMDAWMALPDNFDSTKKYPVLFYVYTEPWGQNVQNRYGITYNPEYRGSLSKDGYIYISIDNRGTPCPKGREWRKCVYRKLGQININDQAMAAKKFCSGLL